MKDEVSLSLIMLSFLVVHLSIATFITTIEVF